MYVTKKLLHIQFCGHCLSGNQFPHNLLWEIDKSPNCFHTHKKILKKNISLEKFHITGDIFYLLNHLVCKREGKGGVE